MVQATRDERIITPAKNIVGALRLPGDKSISHRYAMLAALAHGVTTLENFSTGADCASTVSCITQLGAQVVRKADALEITGTGMNLLAPHEPLDCGNSGSTIRMMAGILAAQSFASELRGDDSLSRRPMARIAEPLRCMGANIQLAAGDCAPLRIAPVERLHAIDYRIPVASAQVKTSLLLAGLLAEGETVVEEPMRTRDHGELALRAFGAEVTRSRNRIAIRGGQKLAGISAYIPGDISSAAFFLCAAVLFPESNLVLENVLLNPTRSSILDVLTQLGARVSIINIEEKHGELFGTIKVEHGELKGAKVSGQQAAQLIDELPVLAAIAPFTRDGIEIRDARELRVKESDRIAAVAENLRRMGAQVTEHDDGISVPGNQPLHGAVLDSHGDHRIAMAFAVAALRASSATTIQGADSASISFPGFWDALDAVAER